MELGTLMKAEARFVPEFHFHRSDGTYAFVTYPENAAVLPSGEYYAQCKIHGGMLNEGAYFVGVAMAGYFSSHWKTEFYDPNALILNIVDPMDKRSNRYGYAGAIPGVVRPKFVWNIDQCNVGR
jgi:hypothetical protein